MIFQYSVSFSSVINKVSMWPLFYESPSNYLSDGFGYISLFKWLPVCEPNYKPILFMILPKGEYVRPLSFIYFGSSFVLPLKPLSDEEMLDADLSFVIPC